MVPALARAALGATATDRPLPGCAVLAVLWYLEAGDTALLCSQSSGQHRIALRTSEQHEFLLSLQHHLLSGPLMLTKMPYTEY